MPAQAYESHKTHISRNRQTNRDQLMNFPRQVIVVSLTHIFIIRFSLDARRRGCLSDTTRTL